MWICVVGVLILPSLRSYFTLRNFLSCLRPLIASLEYNPAPFILSEQKFQQHQHYSGRSKAPQNIPLRSEEAALHAISVAKINKKISEQRNTSQSCFCCCLCCCWWCSCFCFCCYCYYWYSCFNYCCYGYHCCYCWCCYCCSCRVVANVVVVVAVVGVVVVAAFVSIAENLWMRIFNEHALMLRGKKNTSA